MVSSTNHVTPPAWASRFQEKYVDRNTVACRFERWIEIGWQFLNHDSTMQSFAIPLQCPFPNIRGFPFENLRAPGVVNSPEGVLKPRPTSLYQRLVLGATLPPDRGNHRHRQRKQAGHHRFRYTDESRPKIEFKIDSKSNIQR